MASVFYTTSLASSDASELLVLRFRGVLETDFARFTGPVGTLFDDEPQKVLEPGYANYRITIEKMEE